MTWAAGSALAPAGPQAARLAHLYWIFFAVCLAVYLVMIALLLVALSRRSSDAYDEARRLRLGCDRFDWPIPRRGTIWA